MISNDGLEATPEMSENAQIIKNQLYWVFLYFVIFFVLRLFGIFYTLKKKKEAEAKSKEDETEEVKEESKENV